MLQIANITKTKLYHHVKASVFDSIDQFRLPMKKLERLLIVDHNILVRLPVTYVGGEAVGHPKNDPF